MAVFLLMVPFVLLLCFGGYTSGWNLFDCWWSGGAVISGALLFSGRPIRFHFLGFFLLPALAALIVSFDGTTPAYQNMTWWVLAVFLAFFVPTCASGADTAAALFGTLRVSAAALIALYAIQKIFDIPVRGFGMAPSAEAQLLIGAAASVMFKPYQQNWTARRRLIWAVVLCAGVIANGERSAVLGAGILAAVYLGIRAGKFRLAFVAAAISVIAVVLITSARLEKNPHAEARLQVYELALQIFSEHPFGAGMNSFISESLSRNFPTLDPRQLSQYAKIPNHAHNFLLQWAVLAGIPGMAAALSLAIAAWVFLIRQFQMNPKSWPHESALAWAPALTLELCVNVSESLSMIRWICLVGLMSVTPDFSVAVTRKPSLTFRLAVMAVGAILLAAGLNDLFARQALRIGQTAERRGDAQVASEQYLEAHRRRPWDVQPDLHLAQLSISAGNLDQARTWLSEALAAPEAAGTAPYFASRFYTDMVRKNPADTESIHRSRYLIRSVAAGQAYDAPLWLESVQWPMSESERIWRLRQVLRLEPRAAVAYDALAEYAASRGDHSRSDRFRNFAGSVRRRYGPGVIEEMRTYGLFNRNVYRYESALIFRRPNPLREIGAN